MDSSRDIEGVQNLLDDLGIGFAGSRNPKFSIVFSAVPSNHSF